MIEERKIPIAVLTGFLGAGKTTLLKSILTVEHGQKIAVIENEYGAVGIDQHLIEHVEENLVVVQNGCICCTVRTDLVESIINLRSKSPLIDSIVIETTGLADPAPIVQTLVSHPKIKHLVELHAVITVVDAEQIELNLSERIPEFASQIATADLMVLSKIDRCDPGTHESRTSILKKLNPYAPIIAVQPGDVQIPRIFERKLFGQLPMKFLPVARDATVPDHTHSQVHSRVFEVEGTMDRDRLEVFLNQFLKSFSKYIFRAKGIVHIQGETRPVLIQIVRHVFDVGFCDVQSGPDSINRFVMIASSDFFFDSFQEWLEIARSDPHWRNRLNR